MQYFVFLLLAISISSCAAQGQIQLQGNVSYPTISGVLGPTGFLGLVSTCVNCITATVYWNATLVQGNVFLLSVPALVPTVFTFAPSIGFVVPLTNCYVNFVGTTYNGAACQYFFTNGTSAYELDVQGWLWSISQVAVGTPLVASGYFGIAP